MPVTPKKFQTKCTSLYADARELKMLNELKQRCGYKNNSSILRRGLYNLYAEELGSKTDNTCGNAIGQS
jgi:hypothetical protein